ncbi:HNH endonuclease [Sorangium sp. So ce1099]|uniref:HNH endonuclease n=1 Tax=Sorangium sp. So ce1099 TaxID=3133331 RepID=UPI003F5E5EC0
MDLFDLAIYVNASPARLEEASNGARPSVAIVENKRWVRGRQLLEQARENRLELPLIFAQFEPLTSWALARDIVVHESTTEYRFAKLRRLRGHRRSDLTLDSTGGPLPDSFIRSYAIVRTPPFLRRAFRTPESYEYERSTRDMVADFLRERGFANVRDQRKPYGESISQAVYATAADGERIAMRVRLCWRRTGRAILEQTYSAAQLLHNIKNSGWEATLAEKMEREQAKGITHLLLVQRDQNEICYAALIPTEDVLPIWRDQRDMSQALIDAGQLGKREKNHAMNGTSPTLWLQDDRAPAVAEVLWKHPRVRDVAAMPKLSPEPLPNEVSSPERVIEGARSQIVVNAYERDSRARRACVAHHGTRCSACGIALGEVYGEIAAGLIHVHHLRPLSEIRGEYELDPIKDLRPVCPNCHAVIHRRSPALTIEEVRAVLARAKGA